MNTMILTSVMKVKRSSTFYLLTTLLNDHHGEEYNSYIMKALQLENTVINIDYYIGKIRKGIIKLLDLYIDLLKRKGMHMIYGFIFNNLFTYNSTKFVIFFSHALEY